MNKYNIVAIKIPNINFEHKEDFLKLSRIEQLERLLFIEELCKKIKKLINDYNCFSNVKFILYTHTINLIDEICKEFNISNNKINKILCLNINIFPFKINSEKINVKPLFLDHEKNIKFFYKGNIAKNLIMNTDCYQYPKKLIKLNNNFSTLTMLINLTNYENKNMLNFINETSLELFIRLLINSATFDIFNNKTTSLSKNYKLSIGRYSIKRNNDFLKKQKYELTELEQLLSQDRIIDIIYINDEENFCRFFNDFGVPFKIYNYQLSRKLPNPRCLSRLYSNINKKDLFIYNNGFIPYKNNNFELKKNSYFINTIWNEDYGYIPELKLWIDLNSSNIETVCF